MARVTNTTKRLSNPVRSLGDLSAERTKAAKTIKDTVGKDYYDLKTERGRQRRYNKLSPAEKRAFHEAEAAIKGQARLRPEVAKQAKRYAKTANTNLKKAGMRTNAMNANNALREAGMARNANIAAQRAPLQAQVNAMTGGASGFKGSAIDAATKMAEKQALANRVQNATTSMPSKFGIQAARNAAKRAAKFGSGGVFSAVPSIVDAFTGGFRQMGRMVHDAESPEAAKLNARHGMLDTSKLQGDAYAGRNEVINRFKHSILNKGGRLNGSAQRTVPASKPPAPPTPKQNANDVAAAAKVQSDNKLRQDQQRRVKNVKQQMAKQAQSTKKPPTQAIAKGQNQYNNTLKAQERFDNMYGPRGMTQGVPTAKERKPIDDQYDDRALTEALLRKISGK